ncbi:hypothetical protein DOY81_001865, partial [Sarcophaga bullata]
MCNKINLNILLTLACMVALSGAIYVPEHTEGVRHEEDKSLQSDLQQIANKYQLNLNADVANNYNINNNDVSVEDNDNQQKLITAKYTKTSGQPLLLNVRTPQKSYDIAGGVDDVVNAKTHTSKNEHENLEAQPTGLAELQQQHFSYNNDVAMNEQQDGDEDTLTTLTHSRQKRQLSDFLIAPNTRWCGRGNTANGTYNHLGGASMADKCCRTHDHCKLYIPAMSNRFDLFNYRPYTLSHCNCDRRFRTCLKMANDEDANTIGKLFFNLVQTQCFVLTKEV